MNLFCNAIIKKKCKKTAKYQIDSQSTLKGVGLGVLRHEV